MPDFIKLLPDHVANQIAAGEVILRPASVVKELLENAIDAGGQQINIVIKDGGKSLIQVIDDGKGMSDTDARMCFERHATSKLQSAEDLFAIKTMGFRGEALASIAAIAQVELRTRKAGEELGTEIHIEGSKVKKQEAVACQPGTSFSVRNLFFNVPARRNFLKSDTAENNHILEEFFRIALVNPAIAFSLFQNGREIYHLLGSSLRQRVVQIFGSSINEKLVPIEQSTSVVEVSGFIGKPQHAKKNRGEQYMFVNGRYIRHPYFHHAVDSAYKQLIPEGYFPSYFLFFLVDPATLDVNVHPTKTEVKFLNDKVIYSILHSATRQALGRFNLTPSIEFDVEQSLDLGKDDPNRPVIQPQLRLNPDYNPFQVSKAPDPLRSRHGKDKVQSWEKLYESALGDAPPTTSLQPPDPGEAQVFSDKSELFQLKNQYIVSGIRSGMMIIDQQRAHERVCFERILKRQENKEILTQQELFPLMIRFNQPDSQLISDLLPDLRQAGFSIEQALHQDSTFAVTGIPVEMDESMVQPALEEILDSFKNLGKGMAWDKSTRLAASLAKNICIRAGKPLQSEEMQTLVEDLFSCKLPSLTPDGKPVLTVISTEELLARFKGSGQKQ